MLVKHVRDWYVAEEFDKLDGKYTTFANHPVATIVALDENRIGISICKESESFNKKLGVQIARGRAEKMHSAVVPNRIININVDSNFTFPVSLDDVLTAEVNKMEVRAKKYFKKKEAVNG